MDREDMTTGEISRALQRIERDHGAMLAEIREQTIKTNGTVGRHEERLRVVERDVGRMQQQRTNVMQALASDGDKRSLTVSVPMDAKTVVILLTALATVILLVAKGGWLP